MDKYRKMTPRLLSGTWRASTGDLDWPRKGQDEDNTATCRRIFLAASWEEIDFAPAASIDFVALAESVLLTC